MFQPRTAFAVNISDATIEALELARSQGVFAIKSYGRVHLESGVVQDGKILDAEKLKLAVRTAIREAKPEAITARDVVVTIPESKVFAHLYSLPKNVPYKQIPAALFLQAKESMPIEAARVAADYIEVGRRDETIDYLFVASYRDLVDEYVAFFKSIGLKTTLVTMESMALGAAVADEKMLDPLLVLDIGSRTTIASVFIAGKLQETININIAGDGITKALSEKMKISFAEAEQRKRSVGMTPSGAGEEMLVIQGQLQPLKDELLLFIKYYEERSQNTIHHVILAGGSAQLPGLNEYLESNLGLSVVLADALPQYRFSVAPVSISKYLVVLGLAAIAVGSVETSIDFLKHTDKDWLPKGSFIPKEPGEFTSTKITSKTKRMAVLLILIALAFGGLYGWKQGWFEKSVSEQVTSVVKTIGVVVEPFTGKKESEATLSISFTAVPSGVTDPSAAVFLAEFPALPVAGNVSYDAATVDYINRQLPEGFSAEAADIALKNYLGMLLWEQEHLRLTRDFILQNRKLLETPIRFEEIAITDPAAPTDNSGVITVTLNALVRAAVISDAELFTAFVSNPTSVFESEHPDLEFSEVKYAYTETSEGQYRVLAQHIYRPHVILP